MPVYEYSALNQKGKSTAGVIDADSPVDARQKLRTDMLFPVSIEEVAERSPDQTSSRTALFNYFRRVRPMELAAVTRQLATLTGAGFPLVSALETLMPQAKSRSLQQTLAKVKERVVEGGTFAQALEQFPGTFTPVYINMVRAGESSGTLELILERLADITEKQEALKTRIQAALAYPLLMALVGVLVVFFLLTAIVPNILTIFADVGQTLPLPTRILMGVSRFFGRFWPFMLLLMVAGALFYFIFNRTPKGRLVFDQIRLQTPFFGNLIRQLSAARISRTLGSLLENGVPMMHALEIVQNVTGNGVLSKAVAKTAKEVGHGKPLGRTMGLHSVFPELFVQMVTVGEQSGDLETMLGKVADIYENDVQQRIMTITAMLEPLMILFMGVIVGFIVLSICLPIFEMNQLVG